MRIFLIVSLVVASGNCFAQKEADKSELLNEFAKVMSFSAKEYISYSMLTKVASVPVMQPEDTTTIRGVFYKNGNSIYSGNGIEETYFQDSFFIEVNHTRKTIWVNKATPKEFEKLAGMPVSNAALKKITGENFTVGKTVAGTESKLVFETTRENSGATISTLVGLAYSNESFLPSVFDMKITMQQPWSEELAAELKASGIDHAALIQKKEGSPYLVREQSVQVIFEKLGTTQEGVMKMPVWTDKFAYSASEKKFTTKDVYGDYEITQLF